jgi:ATP-dependent Lon protease
MNFDDKKKLLRKRLKSPRAKKNKKTTKQSKTSGKSLSKSQNKAQRRIKRRKKSKEETAEVELCMHGNEIEGDCKECDPDYEEKDDDDIRDDDIICLAPKSTVKLRIREDEEDEVRKTYLDYLDEDALTEIYRKIQNYTVGISSGENESKERRGWARGLTNEEVKKYEPLFKEIDEEQLSYEKILKANLTWDEKKEALKVFMTYSSHSNQVKSVVKLIKNRQEVEEKKLHSYENLEKELQLINIRKLSLKDKILDLNLDNFRKSIVYEKYLHYENLDGGSGDHSKLSEWFNWVLKMPWGKEKKLEITAESEPDSVQEFLGNIKNRLDKCAYGLDKAKEEIVLYGCDKVASIMRKGESKNLLDDDSYILALEGSPGVGKTLLLKNLSKALGLPLEIIPLGGIQDSSYLDGHGFTYEGSKPGRIIEALKNMKCMNGIIFFDELDKISDSKKGEEVTALLLHILDPVLNVNYSDKYFSDLTVDLSKILFVISINDQSKIPEALKHRIKIVKIPDPNIKEKFEIAKNFMFPSFMRKFDLEDRVSISDECIRYIIQKCPEEKGVRILKRTIKGILSRINYLRYAKSGSGVSFDIKDFSLPFIVERRHIDLFLKSILNEIEGNSAHSSMYV